MRNPAVPLPQAGSSLYLSAGRWRLDREFVLNIAATEAAREERSRGTMNAERSGSTEVPDSVVGVSDQTAGVSNGNAQQQSTKLEREYREMLANMDAGSNNSDNNNTNRQTDPDAALVRSTTPPPPPPYELGPAPAYEERK